MAGYLIIFFDLKAQRNKNKAKNRKKNPALSFSGIPATVLVNKEEETTKSKETFRKEDNIWIIYYQ